MNAAIVDIRLTLYGIVALITVSITSCQIPNHHLIHPRNVPPTVKNWSQEIRQNDLLVHLEWAAPMGSGPWPTVLVHPEGGKTTEEMKGVIWDLASRGYLAVAADYKRRLKGKFRRNTFPWRAISDVTAALDHVQAHPLVDHRRIAAVGFSQGAIFSLLIAAHAPQRIKAVVAYYPVTDFEHWLDKKRNNLIHKLVYRIIRWHFKRQYGARSESEFREVLRRSSPLHYAADIKAPVLLIHGDRDSAASKEQSERLARRLKSLGSTVDLLIVPGGVHIFNFRQPDLADLAWRATLDWLERNGVGSE